MSSRLDAVAGPAATRLRPHILGVAGLTFALPLIACSPTGGSVDQPQPAPPPMQQAIEPFTSYTLSPQRAAVEMPVGGRLQVRILSGADSGYLVKLTTIDPKGLLADGGMFVAQNANTQRAAREGLAGADADEVFNFTGVKIGTVHVGWRARRGDYDRPPDDQVLDVTIVPAQAAPSPTQSGQS